MTEACSTHAPCMRPGILTLCSCDNPRQTVNGAAVENPAEALLHPKAEGFATYSPVNGLHKVLIPNPETRIPTPETRNPNHETRIPNPESL